VQGIAISEGVIMSRDKEDREEAHMRRVLEAEGFAVCRVPTTSTETADYRVSDGDNRYVIEVKRKEDDDARIEAFNKKFAETGEARREEPAGRTNAIAGIIQKAAGQLKSIACPGEFKVIWFAPRGESPELQIDQFRSTVYGEVPMILVTGNQVRPPVPCYYYTFSKFFEFKEVDAAIVATESKGLLYLNDFSQSASQFRATKLFKMFEACNAAVDPTARERVGEALILDGSVNRRDKAACYSALLKKYSFRPDQLLPFEEGQVSIARIDGRSSLGCDE
jgi:hypothetical protein